MLYQTIYSNLTENLKWISFPSIAFIVYRSYRWFNELRKLPPGPIGIPWIGYTPCIGDGAFEELQKLHDFYGHIISFRICGQLIVVFDDIQGIRTASLENRSWIGRHTMLTNHLLAGTHGISNYENEMARHMRRCLVRHLPLVIPSSVVDRDNNTGNEKSQEAHAELLEHIQGPGVVIPKDPPQFRFEVDNQLDLECEKLVTSIKESAGSPVNVNQLVRRLVWMVVWKTVFGSECSLEQEEISGLMTSIARNNSLNGPFQFKQMLPLYLSSFISRSAMVRKFLGIDQIWCRYQYVLHILAREVDKRMATNKLPDSCLLAAMRQENFSKEDLYRICFELMAAGVDTTTLTIIWACNCWATGELCLRPTEGFTQDHLDVVNRRASVVPLALPHVARYDKIIDRYMVPKGAIIIFNLFAVHRSQLNSMNLPNECPISKSSNLKSDVSSRDKTPIPFSLGSRACPGFQFASRLIQRVMSKLVDNFHIEFDECEFVQPAKQAGLTRLPVHERYKFILI